MIIRRFGFNSYLLLSLLPVLGIGCQTEKSKEEHEYATFTVHVEIRDRQSDSAKLISVLRSSPMTLTVDKEPFLNESMVKSAKVIDIPDGGFQLQIEFTKHGGLILEQASARSLGKRFAIYSEFGRQTARQVFPQARWLAAPKIEKRISNGMLTFTPDADRKEADEIALALNNLVRVRKERSYIEED